MRTLLSSGNVFLLYVFKSISKTEHKILFKLKQYDGKHISCGFSETKKGVTMFVFEVLFAAKVQNRASKHKMAEED